MAGVMNSRWGGKKPFVVPDAVEKKLAAKIVALQQLVLEFLAGTKNCCSLFCLVSGALNPQTTGYEYHHAEPHGAHGAHGVNAAHGTHGAERGTHEAGP